MDVVYTTTIDAPEECIELRYSLRSLEKHAKGIFDVWIVGYIPGWLKGVKTIPMPNDREERWQNVHSKISRACMTKAVSDDFLYIADDVIFTRDFIPKEYPYYYSKPAMAREHETRKILHELGKEKKLFNIHTPIRYNKEAFLNLPIPNPEAEHIFIRSVYANIHGDKIEQAKDNVVLEPLTKSKIQKASQKVGCFSISDRTAEEKNVQVALASMFPQKSRWEC